MPIGARTVWGRHEDKFPFPTFSQYSFGNYFPGWVGNSVFHSYFQSQKSVVGFFILIPNPKSWG